MWHGWVNVDVWLNVDFSVRLNGPLAPACMTSLLVMRVTMLARSPLEVVYSLARTGEWHPRARLPFPSLTRYRILRFVCYFFFFTDTIWSMMRVKDILFCVVNVLAVWPCLALPFPPASDCTGSGPGPCQVGMGLGGHAVHPSCHARCWWCSCSGCSRPGCLTKSLESALTHSLTH